MQAQAVRVIAAREWFYCRPRLVAGVGLYSFRGQEHRKLLAAAVAGDLSVVGAQQPYERTQACSDIDLQGWMCSLDPNLTRIATQADESQQT